MSTQSELAVTPEDRRKVRTFRAAMRAFRVFSRVRGPGRGLRVDRFRYGDQSLEQGDWLTAAGPRAGSRTPIVYVHGGGWICGHREMYTRDLGDFVRAGYEMANLDYPLAPEHPHPSPLASLLRALVHLRETNPSFSRVHLMGDSAGGNLVAMLAMLLAQPEWLERIEVGASARSYPDIASVVSLYGVLDRISWVENGFPGSTAMMHCYGGPASLEQAVGPELSFTPLDLAPVASPPMLLAVGDQDPLAESSHLAHAHLQNAGLKSRLEVYAGQGHGFFNLSWRPECQRLRSDVLGFLAEHELPADEQ